MPILISDKESMKRIVYHLKACVVLHNFVVEELQCPVEWFEKVEDGHVWLEEDDELNCAAPPDGTRRDQLKYYISNVYA